MRERVFRGHAKSQRRQDVLDGSTISRQTCDDAPHDGAVELTEAPCCHLNQASSLGNART